VATDARAWQRTTKRGKTVAYARVGENSVRLSGDGDVVRSMLAQFSVKLGVVLDFSPPEVIEGQTDIYEQLGAQA
jgi:hypothetical protein